MVFLTDGLSVFSLLLLNLRARDRRRADIFPASTAKKHKKQLLAGEEDVKDPNLLTAAS